MGMFSEIHAGVEAEKLEKVLLKARKSQNPDIMEFCKKNILPLYIDACGEAFDEGNKALIEFYEELV